jgi:hypothetical protein
MTATVLLVRLALLLAPLASRIRRLLGSGSAGYTPSVAPPRILWYSCPD